MNTTVRMKASAIAKDWHVIDAAGRPLGRVATEAATLLRGKHKPTYEPHLDGGDFVIVVNARKVRVSGNKAATMTYYRHSGYPGGLKARSFEEQLERFPEKVIERAIFGMLPKGALGQQIRKHLKVYAGPDHPHAAQVIGSEKARARREEALANGGYIARVMPRLARLKVQAALEAPAAEDEPAALPSAPEAARAAEEGADTDSLVAVESATEDEAPKPRRRRARKTDETEDSGE
jgi:large subunit ribosomal protein L13